jgi:hypothetical protein
MVANTSPAGFLPKTAVVASRAVYYPFTIPTKLNESATLTGAALNGMVKGINASIGNAYQDLQPRGPAKWLLPLFARIDKATDRSQQIADRNKAVFWDPFAQGTEQIGRAIAGPGAYWYLRKSGVENPGQDAIKAVLQQGLFDFGPPTVAAAPSGDAGGGQVDPAAIEAAAQQGAQDAAAGAGQAGAEQQAAA